MRSKVRGLRAIERRVLEDRRHPAVPEPLSRHETPKTAAPPHANTPEAQAPAQVASGDGWCTIHNVALKATTKNGRTWRSHRTADGQWCKGN
jgi:hypothetical protein